MSGPILQPLPKYYSTSRELRNLAEKQRRDKLNHYLSELASMVPYVATSRKKIDKTSILRLTAAYLRLHKVFSRCQQRTTSLPQVLTEEETIRRLLNLIGGFLLVLSSRGKVVYVSDAIEETFGYTQSDVVGRCFYSMIHPDDAHLLRHQLQMKADSFRRSFFCRLMKKESVKNDKSKYEIINITGQIKPFSDAEEADRPTGFVSTKACNKRKYPGFEDSECNQNGCHSDTSEGDVRPGEGEERGEERGEEGGEEARMQLQPAADTHLLIAFVEVVRDRPITEISLIESTRDEYITRHQVDGSILHVDHRISFVTGLMPSEVIGKCAFNYMHQDDVLWSIVAQKQMMGNAQGQGIVTYRLQCKNNSYVTLRSRGFLEISKATGRVESFICINTVLNSKEAETETKQQRKNLLPLLEGKSEHDVVEIITSGLPTELKALVQCLITRQTLERMFVSIGNAGSSLVSDVNSLVTSPHATKKGKVMPEDPLASTSFLLAPNDKSSSSKGTKCSGNAVQNNTDEPVGISLLNGFEVVSPTPSRLDKMPHCLNKMPNCLDRKPNGCKRGAKPPKPIPTAATLNLKKPVTQHPPMLPSASGFPCICKNVITSIMSCQPSYAQLENWGYPAVTPVRHGGSARCCNQRKSNLGHSSNYIS